IGLQFYYHKNGINIFAKALLRVINAKVNFILDITPSGIETAGVDLEGELGIDMQAEAASEQNFNANLHKVVYEPIDFSIPLGLTGALAVPFSVTFGSTMSINTGFSAKTSKITASGLYTFGGGIWAGKRNGSWSVSTTPNPKAVTDIGQTVDGISMGI